VLIIKWIDNTEGIEVRVPRNEYPSVASRFTHLSRNLWSRYRGKREVWLYPKSFKGRRVRLNDYL